MCAAVILIFLLRGTVYAHPSGCLFSNVLNQFVHQIDDFLGGQNELRALLNISKIHTWHTWHTRDDYQVDVSHAFHDYNSAVSHAFDDYQSDVSHAFDPDLLHELLEVQLWSNLSEPRKIWVPKVPRRVYPFMWPSVMNPNVYEEVIKSKRKDEYLEVNREDPELPGKPTFKLPTMDKLKYRRKHYTKTWNFIRYLIMWVANEVPKNGFRTIFPHQVDILYKEINKHRDVFIQAVKMLVEHLVKAIVVLHHNNIFVKKFREEYDACSRETWLEKWEENFECWIDNTKEKRETKNLLYYFKEYVFGSYDIVTAWLFDFVSGDLTSDNDTLCALGVGNIFKIAEIEGVEGIEGIDGRTSLEHYMDTYHEKREMLVKEELREMADHFFTCEVINTCTVPDVLKIEHGDVYERGSPIQLVDNTEIYLRATSIPRLFECRFRCTDMPTIHKRYTYSSAALTTVAGYTFAPVPSYPSYTEIEAKLVGGYYEVTSSLMPRVVKKVILDFQYTSCWPCSREKISKMLFPEVSDYQRKHSTGFQCLYVRYSNTIVLRGIYGSMLDKITVYKNGTYLLSGSSMSNSGRYDFP